MLAKDGQQTTEDAIETAKRNTYMTCERIFRGTPTQMTRILEDGTKRILTYNKDLAYLSGKIIASHFIETASDEDFDLSFTAKIDPTNHRQLELAKDIMIEK